MQNKDRPLIFVRLFPEQGNAAPIEKWKGTPYRIDKNTWVGVPYRMPRQGSRRPGVPLDISDKLISFRYEDEERKADRLEITLDNQDLSEFDNPAWKKGGILEVRWGYPGNMTPTRRVVIQKISGGLELRIEALGEEVLLNKVKQTKVYEGKTLHQIAGEVWEQHVAVVKGFQDVDAVRAGQGAAKSIDGFDEWYAQLAAKIGLDKDPNNRRHFYDYRALYADVRAGRAATPTSRDNMPAKYRRGVPSMWVRDADGTLIDAKSGRAVSDKEVEKAAISSAPSAASAQAKTLAEIDPAATEVKIAHAAQSAQTNAQFVATLARKYGYRFYMDHKGFHFVSVDKVYKQKPSKTIEWFNGNGEWLDFDYENDGSEKSAKVTIRGVDPENKRKFEQTGSDDETKRNGLAPRVREVSSRTGTQTMTDRIPAGWKADGEKAAGAKQKSGVAPVSVADEEDVSPSTSGDPELAKKKADGKYKRRAGHQHELSGTLIGDPKFLAKTILKVQGLGRRLSGHWAVKKVEHSIDSSGYTCKFEAERDGDNGYGEKGEADSKASLPTEDKESKKNPQTGHTTYRVPDQRTGVMTLETRPTRTGS